MELHQILDSDNYERLIIMLDREDLLQGHKLNLSQEDLVIQCFSKTFYPKLTLVYTDNYFNSTQMSSSIGHYNYDAFVSCLDKGEMVNYPTITIIILKMRVHLGSFFPYSTLEAMLMIAIGRGNYIDREQYNMLSTLRPSTIESVTSVYGQPFWKKACANMSGSISPDLRELAISLGLDYHMDKETICTELSSIQKLDNIEKYNQAIMRREELRMAATLGQPEDFLDGKIPTFACRNKGVLPYNPTEINALDISYFRDTRGAIWCIPSSSFDDVLQRKINPYTSEALPQDFLITVKAKKDVLEELGLKPANRAVMTYPEAIKKIQTVDGISNDMSEKVLAGFIQICIVNGVPEVRIRNLTPQEITQILRSNQIFVDLSGVTGLEALYFLSYTVRDLSKRNNTAAVAVIRSIH